MHHISQINRISIAALACLPSACLVTEYRDTHCSNNDGDAFCRREYSDYSRPYCSLECEPDVIDGCVEVEPEPSCYSACGGRKAVIDDPACEPMPPPDDTSSTGTDTTASESGTTDESSGSTTGPQPCTGNDDCPDAAAPFCEPVSGECVACDGTDDPDAACGGLDPLTPLCVGGACVQCTAAAPEACTGETPVCDDATNTCVPCTEHGQCGEAACNLFTGACLPGDAVVHVGAGEEYTTIGAAVMSFDPMAEGTIIVHAGDYNESVTVDGGRVLAFLAAELGPMVEPPRWVRNSGSLPQLTVTDATVLMDGMQVSGNASSMVPGVLVDAGRAWLDRSRVVQNSGGGIVAQNAAELVLQNCFVGGSINEVMALDCDASTASIVYTTIGAGYGAATALACNAEADVSVSASILVSQSDGDEVQCDATIEQSATELDLGGSNIALGPMQTTWFVGYTTGDFHLATAPASIGTAAQWTAGAPLTDIDVEPRPGLDGAPDFAGGDVP